MTRLIVRDNETNSTVASKPINMSKLPTRFIPRDRMLRTHAQRLVCNITALAYADMWYVVVDESNRAIAKGQL